MTGPRRIIDLDDKPPAKWRVEKGANHLFKGRLWTLEPSGCILCFEHEGAAHETLKREGDDGTATWHCLTHGNLDCVTYEIKRTCSVRVGTLAPREFESVDDGFLLVPASVTQEERDRICNELILEAQREEAEETEDE